MRSRGEEIRRPNLRQARPGQIDKLQGAQGFDQRQGAFRELAFPHDIHAGIASECLDERAVDGFGSVEHAIAPRLIVEAVVARAPEVAWLMFRSMNAVPHSLDADDWQGAPDEVVGRGRMVDGDGMP